jgi:exonuclease SbcC
MKLLTHKMAGFNHLSGKFELDFASLPGLVAIVGRNGQGKTSLALEGPLAGLFGPGVQQKAFASREGPLARYATSREAFIDDVWELAAGRFRVRVNVDGEDRKTDAILTQINADGTETPFGDGKITTFREAVGARFPSQRSLLAGPFAGQTRRGSFGELGQKERLELFVELADLAYLELRATTARRCHDVAENVVERIRVALATIRQEVDAAKPVFIVNRLNEIAGLEVEWNTNLEAARSSLRGAEQERERLQGDAQKHAAAKERARGANADVTRAEAALAAVDVGAPLRAHVERVREIDARYTNALGGTERRRLTVVAAYDKATIDRNERIRNNEALIADKAQIEAAVAESERAVALIAARRATEASERTNQSNAREKEGEAQRQLGACISSASELEAAKRRASLLGTVKFGDDCGVAPACPLVTDAVDARDRITALALAAEPAHELQVAISHWAAEQVRHGQSIAGALRDIREAEAVIAKANNDVKRQPYLSAAENRIAEYRADQKRADEAHAVAVAAFMSEVSEAKDAHDREVVEAEEAMERAKLANATRLTELEAELAKARNVAAAAAVDLEGLAAAPVLLAQAAALCAELQGAVSAAESVLARMSQERTHLSESQAKLARLHARNEELERRLRVGEDEMLAWKALANRLGRDGLQRLEIDAAGPVVSDLANQLLEVGWGPRFAVSIVTQVATADKKDMKEKFTIEVLDNAHGGEVRDVGDLSGGERVVVEEAIRAALACYVNLRSRQPSRTIWRDEADGGLDEDAAPRYLQMLRKLRELSGAEQLVFITHNAELAAMADAVVEVEDGQVKAIRRAA